MWKSYQLEMDHFDQVAEFMNAFEQPVRSKPTELDDETLHFRLSLVEEETRELREAVEAKDYVEMVDALADIIYVVDGFAHSLGVDLREAFRLVHESNMTKLCSSEEEARETVEWYKANETRYDSPTYRKSSGGKWMVYNESTGKALKSIHYHPVDLKHFSP